MNVNWNGSACIFCLKVAQLTLEHLIPSSIGGMLTSRFLCRDCNSAVGARVESALRNDPTIRLSADRIRDANPDLARQIEENQRFIIHSTGEPGRAIQKGGEIRLIPRKAADGSLILPTEMARTSLAAMLDRNDISGMEIEDALAKFDSVETNTRLEVYPGIQVCSWETTKIERDLSKSELANPLIPLKIAFEFLACHLAESIYEDAPQLNEIRGALLANQGLPRGCKVDRLHADKARPIHGIVHEGNSPHTTVQVRLFGQLAFRVQFLRVAVQKARFVYTHDLGTGKEEVRTLSI